MKKKIIFIIAHFHPEGRVHEYLLNFITHVSTFAEKIIFASTNLNSEGRNSLINFCDVIDVDNIGYDFWSYKMGINYLGSELLNSDELVIMNSSFVIFDPLKLTSVFFTDDDYVGIKSLTKADIIGLHAQSYYISFKGNSLINSDLFKRWWEDLTPISDKNSVILNYEIGMSQYFIKGGCSLISTYNPNNENKLICISRAIGIRHLSVQMNAVGSEVIINLEWAEKVNPTHFLWDDLEAKLGIIKIELIKNNGSNQDLLPYLKNLELSFPQKYQILIDALA